jgi:hypothetical protein
VKKEGRREGGREWKRNTNIKSRKQTPAAAAAAAAHT